jgi:phage terminase small subunit
MSRVDEIDIPKPPRGLSRAACKLWRELLTEFALDDPQSLAILTVAMECYDTMSMARAEVKRDGVTVLDRYNGRKIHPAFNVESRAREGYLRALKQLKIDPNAISKG